MNSLQQKDAVYSVAGIEGFHVVALGAPVPRRRQERVRAACLAVLVEVRCHVEEPCHDRRDGGGRNVSIRKSCERVWQ